HSLFPCRRRYSTLRAFRPRHCLGGVEVRTSISTASPGHGTILLDVNNEGIGFLDTYYSSSTVQERRSQLMTTRRSTQEAIPYTTHDSCSTFLGPVSILSASYGSATGRTVTVGLAPSMISLFPMVRSPAETTPKDIVFT